MQSTRLSENLKEERSNFHDRHMDVGKARKGLSSSVAGENSAVIGSARDRNNNNQTRLELLRLTPVHI